MISVSIIITLYYIVSKLIMIIVITIIITIA